MVAVPTPENIKMIKNSIFKNLEYGTFAGGFCFLVFFVSLADLTGSGIISRGTGFTACSVTFRM
jgi:hypothetical protein